MHEILIVIVAVVGMIAVALIAGGVARFGGAAEDDLQRAEREERELSRLQTHPRMR